MPLKISIRQIINIVAIVLMAQQVQAKIGDPPPVTENGVTYKSHNHIVTAIDAQSGAIIWETDIPMDKYTRKYDPKLEEDVQWNIIMSIKAIKDQIIVSNGKSEEFSLDKKTGALLSSVEITNTFVKKMSEDQVLLIAEPLLRKKFPTYDRCKPYRAELKQGVWHVYGTLPSVHPWRNSRGVDTRYGCKGFKNIP